MPARARDDVTGLGQSGDRVQRLRESSLSLASAVEELLEHGESLCLPPTQHRVHHAVGFQTEEDLEVLLRQIHVHLEMLETRGRRHRVGVSPTMPPCR